MTFKEKLEQAAFARLNAYKRLNAAPVPPSGPSHFVEPAPAAQPVEAKEGSPQSSSTSAVGDRVAPSGGDSGLPSGTAFKPNACQSCGKEGGEMFGVCCAKCFMDGRTNGKLIPERTFERRKFTKVAPDDNEYEIGQDMSVYDKLSGRRALLEKNLAAEQASQSRRAFPVEGRQCRIYRKNER